MTTEERPRKPHRLSPQRQAQHDQLLAALRDAGPAGLLTQEAGRALTRECPCQHHPPRGGGHCYACKDTGRRPMINGEVMPLLVQLERRGMVTAERARLGSGIQNRWHLAPGVVVAEPEAEHPELEDWWEALAAAAGDLADVAEEVGPEEPVHDPGPVVAEWLALRVQRDEALALAAGSREAMDDLIVELTDTMGLRIKDVAALLDVPAYDVSNARQREFHRRYEREHPR